MIENLEKMIKNFVSSCTHLNPLASEVESLEERHGVVDSPKECLMKYEHSLDVSPKADGGKVYAMVIA